MRHVPNRQIRIIFTAGIVAIATLGLTGCDPADHYYAFFAQPGPGQTGPDCAVYCVNYGDIIDPNDNVVVHHGDVVGFYNLVTGNYKPSQKTEVTVKLTYKFPDSTGVSEEFTISEGKSKDIKIKSDIPLDTEIEVLYQVNSGPGHGGPNMIVQP